MATSNPVSVGSGGQIQYSNPGTNTTIDARNIGGFQKDQALPAVPTTRTPSDPSGVAKPIDYGEVNKVSDAQPVSMVDTNSAATIVNHQNDYLNSTYPVTPPANNGGSGADKTVTPPATTPTADFINASGQTAHYTQDQLNDPAIQKFISDNGYTHTSLNGLTYSDTGLDSAKSAANSAEADVETLTKKFLSYNVDQDPAFQTQANNIRASYNNLISAMQQSNASRAAALTTMGMRNGTTQYANDIQSGITGEELKQADGRISDLVTQENSAISAARLAYQNNNFSTFNAQVNALKDIRDQKQQALTDYNTAIVNATKTLQAQAEQAKKDTYDQVTKPIQDIATEAAKNGAGSAVINAINGATSVQDAIKAAGDALQTGTGQMGDYLQYKRDTASNGLTPEDYSTWKAADDKRQAQLKSSEAYATAFATARGKAAGEASANGGSSSILPVTGSNGVTYNVPSAVAPYVKISPSGVKFIDASGLTAAEKGKIITAAYNNGVNPIPVITDASAALDVSNIADATLKLQDMKNAFDPQVAGSAAARDLYFTGAIKMASALQTNPQAVGLDIYQDTALDILKAMSGTKGFRGGQSMVDQVKVTFPQKTDTQAVVDQKIANIQKLIDDRQVSLIGKPSAGDQLLVDNANAKNTINNYVTSIVAQDPKNGGMQANQIGTLASAPGATPASILEYMKLHPETYAAQYLK